MRASGVIFDPYKYIADEDKPSPFSADGLSLKLSTAKSVAKSSYSSAFIQRHIKDQQELRKSITRESIQFLQFFKVILAQILLERQRKEQGKRKEKWQEQKGQR